MPTDEKGVFIQIQNTIVSLKALVLVNCPNAFVHDCSYFWLVVLVTLPQKSSVLEHSIWTNLTTLVINK